MRFFGFLLAMGLLIAAGWRWTLILLDSQYPKREPLLRPEDLE